MAMAMSGTCAVQDLRPVEVRCGSMLLKKSLISVRRLSLEYWGLFCLDSSSLSSPLAGLAREA
jgi:hypothetical protein